MRIGKIHRSRKGSKVLLLAGSACACIAVLVVLLAVTVEIDAEPFVAGFEEGDLAGAEWQMDADRACRIYLSSEYPREGAAAVVIDAPKGRRCELVPRIFPPVLDKFFREPYGRDRWYEFSVLVRDPGPLPPVGNLGENTVVAQWHASPDPFLPNQSGRGPPLALRIHDGNWAITFARQPDFISPKKRPEGNWHWVGPVKAEQWVDWQFRVRWSYGDDGLTEVRRDGQLVMQHRGPNAYNDIRGVYIKLGLYHPTVDTSILLDRVSITSGATEQ